MTHRAETDNRRRIALVTTELSVGGAERCLVNLAVNLDRSRFVPSVYSLRPAPTGAAAFLVQQLAAAGIPTHFLDLHARWQLPIAVRRLRKLLSQDRPHLLQSFLFHANVVSALAAPGAKVRHVLMGIRVADPRPLRHRLERWLSGRVDRIVCVSESVAEFARHYARLPAEKICVIPNGIDVQRYTGVEPVNVETFGFAAQRKLLVSIGRLDPQKGFDRLIQFAQRFLPELPEHDLAIVGAGPELERLHALVNQAQLSDRIHLVGWRSPSEIPAILAASRLVLIPSRWEGMPNVLLEAMAASRPVVATLAHGVSEVLGPLAPQQAVPGGDEDAFVNRVVRLARPAAEDPDWGALNRQRVEEWFSLAAMVRQYETLFENVMSG